MLKNLIQEKKSNKKALCEKFNNGLPNVIYGAGLSANDAIEYAKTNNMKLDYAIVDDEYYVSGKSFNNLTVLKFSDLPQTIQRFNTIIAFSGEITKINERINQLKQYGEVQCYIHDQFSFNYDFIQKNIEAFEQSFNLFEDDLSKKIFIDYLQSKVLEDPTLLCQNNGSYHQGIFELSENEAFVDCGAYIGDTIDLFVKNVSNRYKHIYALEPDSQNFEKLKKNTSHLKNIELYNCGAWNSNGVLSFSNNSNGTISKIDEQGANSITVKKLDDLLSDKQPTYIKMDIEGSEMQALEGAQNVLKTLPKLEICVYHRPDDLIKIPNFLNHIQNSSGRKYKLYLRHHPVFNLHELVVYAV